VADVQNPDINQDIAVDVVEETAVDTGNETGWPDIEPYDFVQDIPEGPFYPKEEGDLVTVTNGTLTLQINLATGTFNIGVNPGLDGIINGHSEVHINGAEGKTVISSAAPAQRATWTVTFGSDGLDDGVTVMFESLPTGSIGGLRTYISLHRNVPSVTVKVMVGMPVREGFYVEKLVPIVARGAEGAGLMIGPGTASAVMINNGSEIIYDGVAEALNVTEATESLNGPGYLSNWNTVICTKNSSCVVAGFLNVERAFTGVAVESVSIEALAVGDDEALSLFEMRATCLQASMLSPSKILASETAYIDFTDDPAAGLKRYAEAVATYNLIGAPKKAPVMMSALVKEDDLTSNDIATRVGGLSDSKELGLEGVVVDLGWQNGEGEIETVKFPNHGSDNAMKWLATTIKAAGLVPGVALAPFVFEKSSALYTAHTDWFVESADIAMLRLGIGNNKAILDLTNEDAKAWFISYISRAVKTWGYDYIKLYDADLGAMGLAYSVDGKTGVLAVIEALKAVRADVGNDIFIDLAGGTMIGIGIVNGMQAAPATYKTWNAPASKLDATMMLGATSWAHRYYMNGAFTTVTPGRTFSFYLPEDSYPHSQQILGMHLWAVTGVTPELGSMPVKPYFDLEIVRTGAVEAWSTDMFTNKIPEMWYSKVLRDTTASYLAGFFRWAGNTDLFTLASTNAGRERTLNLPETTGQWIAWEPAGNQTVAKSGACINPDGATVTIASDNQSRLMVIRDLSSLDSPVFLGIVNSMAGGDAFVTEITGTTGNLSMTAALAGHGDVTLVFALPKGATPTVDVAGATLDGQATDTTTCSDVDLLTVDVYTDTAATDITVTL
jgi:hypothetical protein